MLATVLPVILLLLVTSQALSCLPGHHQGRGTLRLGLGGLYSWGASSCCIKRLLIWDTVLCLYTTTHIGNTAA